MKSRSFWIASVFFAIMAIGVHVASLNQAGKGMKLRAQAVVASEAQKNLMKTEAKLFASRSGAIALVGLCTAIGSVVCAFISAKRHEPAWLSVPATLLAFYLLMQFAIV